MTKKNGCRIAAMGMAAVMAATVALGGGETNAQSKLPQLKAPDESVVLPASAKQEAEAAFAKGYTYFIWPADKGTIKRGDSQVLFVPFLYIAKDKPVPYQTAFTLIVKKNGSDTLEEVTQMLKPEGQPYSARGKGCAMHLDFMKSLSGTGKARLHLLDFETGKNQISNEITVDVEL